MPTIATVPEIVFKLAEDLERDDIVIWKGDPHKVVALVIGDVLVNVYFGFKGAGGFRKPNSNMIRHVGDKVPVAKR